MYSELKTESREKAVSFLLEQLESGDARVSAGKSGATYWVASVSENEPEPTS